MPKDTRKVERLWRCPRDGYLYPKDDQCQLRCWATPGEQEKHEPVTRTTTVVITEGHED
jgi:hypothetical protein